MENTVHQYQEIIAFCKAVFLDKARDYGLSWTILRMPSVTDQIYIKAERIRSIQETGVNKVGDSVEDDFKGVLNYCVIALMLLDMPEDQRQLESIDILDSFYESKVKLAFDTMLKKNHDYGEAWRKMRVSSITDLILMKIHRLKQIEDNQGNTLISEGVDANYIDILNYAVFSLIKLSEKQESSNSVS